MQAQKSLIGINSQLTGPPKALFNPTLILLTFSITGVTLSLVGYYYFILPHIICFFINVVSLHCAGTVIHDASHRTAHSNQFINAIAGHISASLLGFSFPVFTRVHIQHHAHVNDPHNDPDHFVSTAGPLWLIAARFLYHEVYFFQRRLWKGNELLEWCLARIALLGILAISYKFQLLNFVLKFWMCPALIVGLTLGLFFDYLPHHPFNSRNKWTNAKVYPNTILNFIIFGQNYHLVHHLWPSVPWYNYQRVYYLKVHILEENQSPKGLKLFSLPNILWFIYDILFGIKIPKE
nr:fatty-acid desaturase [Cavernulicola chilensis]